MTQPYLYYFEPDEFREWYFDMSPRLLVMLDTLRHQWGRVIEVSPADGALGRRMGESLSQHNVAKWGEVRAVDIFPEGVETMQQAENFWMAARAVGFTGIGLYPDALPSTMFHLDVRIDRKPGNPASWGALRRMISKPADDDDWRYVSLDDAMREVG